MKKILLILSLYNMENYSSYVIPQQPLYQPQSQVVIQPPFVIQQESVPFYQNFWFWLWAGTSVFFCLFLFGIAEIFSDPNMKKALEEYNKKNNN